MHWRLGPQLVGQLGSDGMLRWWGLCESGGWWRCSFEEGGCSLSPFPWISFCITMMWEALLIHMLLVHGALPDSTPRTKQSSTQVTIKISSFRIVVFKYCISGLESWQGWLTTKIRKVLNKGEIMSLSGFTTLPGKEGSLEAEQISAQGSVIACCHVSD